MAQRKARPCRLGPPGLFAPISAPEPSGAEAFIWFCCIEFVCSWQGPFTLCFPENCFHNLLSRKKRFSEFPTAGRRAHCGKGPAPSRPPAVHRVPQGISRIPQVFHPLQPLFQGGGVLFLCTGALQNQHELPLGRVLQYRAGLLPRWCAAPPRGAWSLQAQAQPPFPAEAGLEVLQGGEELVGGLTEVVVGIFPRRDSRWKPSVCLFMPRNPSKVKRPVGRPDTDRAVTRAQGPGMATTSTPLAAHRATSSSSRVAHRRCRRR